MSWGHAVSRDLVRWEHLPIALREEDGIMIFSGSAVVDAKNTCGFGQGPTRRRWSRSTPATATTSQTQNLASSLDRGRTWTKFAGQPRARHRLEGVPRPEGVLARADGPLDHGGGVADKRKKGGERQRLRRARPGVIGEQAHEAERFGAEIGSNHGFRTRSVVALVEEQVDGAQDARETLGQIRVSELIERARAAHDLLRALQSLRRPRPVEVMSAAAISASLNPHESCKTSASCDASGSRGWASENITRSSSSCSGCGVNSSSTVATRVHSLSRKRASSGAASARCASRDVARRSRDAWRPS